ncbi:MAG TPA: polysaccharide deacetylase family protein [Arachnia sp.]|nr:polysaccharide deacetylase family protein [Arachnia sp.]
MSFPPLRTTALAVITAAALAATACAPAGLQGVPSDTPSPPASSPTPPATPPVSPGGPSTEAPPSTPPASPDPSATSPTPSETTSVPVVPPDQLIPGSNHIGAAADYAYSAKTVQRWISGKKKPPKKKLVFLTFDDGPNHKTTPIILDALAKGDARATFFVVGNTIGNAPELLQREIDGGNSIALHSWSHDYSKLYPGRVADPKRIEKEYLDTLAKVQEVLGKDFGTEGWRYPGGHMSWRNMSAADERLAAHGVSWLDWNADTADSAPRSRRPTTVEAMVRNATMPIRAEQRVAVVLGHDTPDKTLTAKSVPAIIKAYEKAGYTFGIIR